MKIVSENAARITPQPIEANKTKMISSLVTNASVRGSLVASIWLPTAYIAMIRPRIVGKAVLPNNER